MTIVRWDPFRNIVTLQDRINRLFDDAFPRSADNQEELAACAWRPLVDIYEADEGVVIKMDLPGVDKEDVSVEVKDNLLHIQGLRGIDASVDEDRYYRRERTCGSFERSFALRTEISPDHIKASFKNGVLTVTIPKPQEEVPKKISVDID